MESKHHAEVDFHIFGLIWVTAIVEHRLVLERSPPPHERHSKSSETAPQILSLHRGGEPRRATAVQSYCTGTLYLATKRGTEKEGVGLPQGLCI